MAISFSDARRRVVLGCTALALAGCATMAETPDKVVTARANDQWKVRIAGNLDQAYTFTPPSYRAATPIDQYKKNFGNAAQVVTAQITEVKCESADRCVATAKLEVKPVLIRGAANQPPLIMYYDEVWVRENAQWWLFPTP